MTRGSILSLLLLFASVARAGGWDDASADSGWDTGDTGDTGSVEETGDTSDTGSGDTDTVTDGVPASDMAGEDGGCDGFEAGALFGAFGLLAVARKRRRD